MNFNTGLGKRLINSSSIVLFFILWESLTRIGVMESNFIAAPSTIIVTIVRLLREENLLLHIFASLRRVLTGFALAGVIGIPTGFILGGWFKTIEKIVYPVLSFLRQFNPFTLFPVFMLLLGIGETSKMAMIFWVCIWPIIFNTIAGAKETEPIFIKSSRSMGASSLTLFFKVLFPSALPFIINGLQMSCGTAFFMLIAAEMNGASNGLGWLVNNSQVNYQVANLFAATVVISILGLFFNNIFKIIEKAAVGWKYRGDQ